MNKINLDSFTNFHVDMVGGLDEPFETSWSLVIETKNLKTKTMWYHRAWRLAVFPWRYIFTKGTIKL